MLPFRPRNIKDAVPIHLFGVWPSGPAYATIWQEVAMGLGDFITVPVQVDHLLAPGAQGEVGLRRCWVPVLDDLFGELS